MIAFSLCSKVHMNSSTNRFSKRDRCLSKEQVSYDKIVNTGADSDRDIQYGTSFVSCHTLRSPCAALIPMLAAACLFSGFAGIAYGKDYACAGKGDNGMVASREFPSLHFDGRRLKISGSDIFSSYSYEICAESATLVTFTAHQQACRAGAAEIKAMNDSNGTFDRASGALQLNAAQGLHGEYQCQEVAKK